MIAEERERQHHVVADRLERASYYAPDRTVSPCVRIAEFPRAGNGDFSAAAKDANGPARTAFDLRA